MLDTVSPGSDGTVALAWNDLRVGTHHLTMTVTDEDGSQDISAVTIDVTSCGFNAPSAVVVGPPAPELVDIVTLDVSISDIDLDVPCSAGETHTASTWFLSRPLGSAATLEAASTTAPSFQPQWRRHHQAAASPCKEPVLPR